MELGETFLGTVIGKGSHLHIVLSNPTDTGCVVLVIIATYDGYQNDTCILYPSDGHPFITRPSYVAYDTAVLFPVASLEIMKQNKEITVKPPFSQDVLKRVLKGADHLSSRITNACWLVLHDQDLVPH